MRGGRFLYRPVARGAAHRRHARPQRSCADRDGAVLLRAPGEAVLRHRIGQQAEIHALAYGETHLINDVRVSLHPAGHVLGSAQVRVEHQGDVWVAAGDYKVAHDPTCASFEPIRCRVFITESTFGLPIYRWLPSAAIFDEINAWWHGNIAQERTSVLYGYSLGKAQRLLAGVDASLGPILVHGAVAPYLPMYAAAGVTLPETQPANAETAKTTKGRALVVAPPSAESESWLRKFGDVSLAFASGWMMIRGTRRRRAADRGFALSDHADWDGLHEAIRATGAERILVTHGYTRQLVRRLREIGYDADTLSTQYAVDEEE
ncbi:MAG: ligase-associated DNA damage response exonuclease [Pirellulales bacterium]